MKYTTMTTITAVAVALSNTSYADEQLDPLVITASGFEQDTTEAPASISVVTAEEIEKGAYRDVAEAIESVPGVQLVSSVAGTAIQIRGLASDYTLLMIDGRPQNAREAQSKESQGFDQEFLPPLSMIERIEVVRGPMSTLYGSAAMGGAVNIITKKHSNEWHGNLRAETTLAEGSEFNDRHKGSIALSGPVIKDKLSLQLNADYLDQEEDELIGGNAEKEATSYRAKVNLSVSDNHDFSLDVSKIDLDRTSTLNQTTTSSKFDEFQENKKESFALIHSGDYGHITETSYIQKDTVDNITGESKIENTIIDTSWLIPTDNHLITVGATYAKAELEASDSSNVSSVSNDQVSIYGEDDWSITDEFSLTIGLRADKNEHFDEQLSPRVYGVWALSDNWTIKGGVSTGYKSPKIRQMYEDWAVAGRVGYTIGNSSLSPETSVSTEVGATYSNDNLIANVTLFDNQFKDMISRVSCTTVDICNDSDNRTYINVDKAETTGTELSAKYNISDSLSTSLSYTYTDSEILSGDAKGDPLTNTPKHIGSFSVNWEATDELNAWIDYQYNGKENEGEEPRPSYELVDIGTKYQFNRQLSFSAGINNLLGKTFDYDDYGFAGPSREYWVALNASF